MHKMKKIMEALEEAACHELSKGIQSVDTKEMGEVVDMIKDCAETMYYYSIYEAMKEAEDDDDDYDEEERKEHKKGKKHYRKPTRYRPQEMALDEYEYMTPEKRYEIEERMGRRYYPSHENWVTYTNNSAMPNSSSTSVRDAREGRSGMSRKMYMEVKERHRGDSPDNKKIKINELEKYMKELSTDITDMIVDASPEEKTLLKQKLATLQQKI